MEAHRSTGVLIASLILLWVTTLTAGKPNFILVMSDDQGWADTGYQGHPHLKTPALDQMSRDGIRFNRFYAAAPVCSPTRGSALTGRHPYRYGIFFANTGHLPDEELTLPELLKPHGYVAGHFGKWHLGTLTTTIPDANRGGPMGKQHFSPPSQNGFDANFSTESKTPTWDPYLRPNSATGKQWWDPIGSDLRAAKPYGTSYWSQGERVAGPLRGDDSELIMNRSLNFINRAVERGEPFIAVIWFHAPHLPVVSNEASRRPYKKFSKYHQHYFGCLAALDRQVGRLRKALQDLQIEENTMLCYCSDNGPEGNSKAPGSAGALRGRKRSLYEGGIRVPGLVVWPDKIRPGTVTNMPACTSDYLPTILDALSVPLPQGRPFDGISLLPVFSEPSTSRKAGIGFQSKGQLAWIEDRYKLYAKPKPSELNQPRESSFELYDLLIDPSERKNIATDKRDVVKDMVARLRRWQTSCQRSLAGSP